jgi:hypothetical protein
MLRDRKQNTRSRRVRHGLVVVIPLLLPLLVVAGALAPGFVTVQYEDEERFVPPKRESYRVVRLAHRALLAAHDYSTRFVHKMTDLEKLFMGPRHRVEVGNRRAQMPHFPRSRGDVIVLSDTHNYIADADFKNVLQPGVVADATSTWDANLFDVIPNSTGPGGSNQYDDFMGQDAAAGASPLVVPEPGTGSLVALGLIGLALRARQRQPATS